MTCTWDDCDQDKEGVKAKESFREKKETERELYMVRQFVSTFVVHEYR